MFGEQDGMVILEAPDAESAAAVAITSASSGTIRNLGTHQLFDQEQLRAALDKAKSVRTAFRPPGT